MDLHKLLAPRAMAVVGASEKEGFGGDTCRNVLDYTTGEGVYFVNPRRQEVFGRKCYPSLADLPEPVDLVVLCTPQKTIEPLLREAAARGAKAAVVYASGYAEMGTPEGRQAEASLTALCRELDIALMGPNCAGFMNYTAGVAGFAFISDKRDRRGGVGVVSQSGQLCLSLMDSPKLRFSCSISSGNSSVVTIEDYLDYLIDDPATRVIGLYLEGVTRPECFVACLRKAALARKPIVALKAGRSEKGSRVAASHTGSLSGADRVYDALFDKFGVIRVNDLEELAATTQLFSTLPDLPRQPGVACVALSGGETAICADMGAAFGVDYPDLTEPTLEKLRTILPAYASPANPLDATATISYDADLYARTLLALMEDPGVGMVVLGYTLLPEIADPAIRFMADGIEQVVRQGPGKPMVMLPFMECSRNPEYLDRLAGLGIPILPPPVYAFRVLGHLAKYLAYDPRAHTLEAAVPRRSGPVRRRTLSEAAAMEMLAGHGVPLPQGAVARDPEEAVRVAQDVGYPVALKIASPDIAHKSDAGGVRLGLTDADAVRAAWSGILDSVRGKAPNAAIDGMLVERMLAPGLEVIVGAIRDPQFGPCVLCGLGGIFVEIFKDTVMLPAPVSEREARDMLGRLKAWPLLAGCRGNRPRDVEALAALIAAVSRFAEAHREDMVELDLNPVFVYEQDGGVRAADALLVLEEE